MHRDDLLFQLSDQPFKSIASQGQRKSLLFALKLAEMEIIREEKRLSPLLLLDDVFEKLDEERISNLLMKVCTDEDTQIFITDTSCDRLRVQLEKLAQPVQMIELWYIFHYFQRSFPQKPVNPSKSRFTHYLRFMGQYKMGDAIKQFLNQSRLKGDIQALQIEELWEKIMGKTIARYTENLKIINRTLFITTNVAPLKQELMYQKEKIKLRVNEALGEKLIDEVVIK